MSRRKKRHSHKREKVWGIMYGSYDHVKWARKKFTTARAARNYARKRPKKYPRGVAEYIYGST